MGRWRSSFCSSVRTAPHEHACRYARLRSPSEIPLANSGSSASSCSAWAATPSTASAPASPRKAKRRVRAAAAPASVAVAAAASAAAARGQVVPVRVVPATQAEPRRLPARPRHGDADQHRHGAAAARWRAGEGATSPRASASPRARCWPRSTRGPIRCSWRRRRARSRRTGPGCKNAADRSRALPEAAPGTADHRAAGGRPGIAGPAAERRDPVERGAGRQRPPEPELHARSSRRSTAGSACARSTPATWCAAATPTASS